MPYVFGLNQGVFRVNVDSAECARSTRRLLLALWHGPGNRCGAAAVNRQPMALDAFGEQIRTAMAAGRTGAR